MVIGILAAMDTEAKSIVADLENSVIEEIAGYTYYRGIYQDKKVVLTICSIGKVSSALSAQIMIDHYGVDFVINTGIAGGLDEDLKILDIVIGERLAYHDFEESVKTDYFPFKEYYNSDAEAVESVYRIAEDEGITAHKGLILTGDQFIESDEKKRELVERFENPMCVEMEGTAISQAAYINDVPSIVIRCISDMADTGGMMTYQEFKEKASDESARIVKRLIEVL